MVQAKPQPSEADLKSRLLVGYLIVKILYVVLSCIQLAHHGM